MAKLKTTQTQFEIARRKAEEEKKRRVAEAMRKAKEEEKRQAAKAAETKNIAKLLEKLKKKEAELAKQAAELAALKQKIPQKKSISRNINFGTYHALVIGINNYENLPRLRTAISDARAVGDLLRSKYGFKVSTLINPTREGILDKLDELRAKLTQTDNLLVYYAGHGWLDKEADQGYWQPVDAMKGLRSRWLSNSSITDTLRASKAKHVMVVADSCYSGSMTRGMEIASLSGDETSTYYRKMAFKKTRVVITSGGLEPVEDGSGKHSPFARAFMRVLRDNEEVIDGTRLFQEIRRGVVLDADNTPQYSNIRRAGHEGGDFLFVRRN